MTRKRLVLLALIAVLLIAAMLPGVSGLSHGNVLHTSSAVIADSGDPDPTPTPTATPDPSPPNGNCHGSGTCGD